MKIETSYTFDDLTLKPLHSFVKSRKQPDVSTKLGSVNLKVPIISAPMNTVTEGSMIKLMDSLGGSSVLHRYMHIMDQINLIYGNDLDKNFALDRFFVAIGPRTKVEHLNLLHENNVKNFCVDVANGHSEICLKTVRLLREKFGDDINIMAGNVCTYEGAKLLKAEGANILRVGIGPGSLCCTRLITGHGVPQLTAIDECSNVNCSIVADGGIRSSGDIVKALAMGADAVMIGGLISGTKETPGEILVGRETKLSYKIYQGMASKEGRSEWFDAEATQFVPEGVATTVEYKGSAKPIVEQLVGGLKVGMSFSNALTLQELRSNAQWTRVTENGRIEGTPNRRMFKR